MKFVSFANKSVCANLIEAITTYNSTLTVHCSNGSKYQWYYDSADMAENERLRLVAELEKL